MVTPQTRTCKMLLDFKEVVTHQKIQIYSLISSCKCNIWTRQIVILNVHSFIQDLLEFSGSYICNTHCLLGLNTFCHVFGLLYISSISLLYRYRHMSHWKLCIASSIKSSTLWAGIAYFSFSFKKRIYSVSLFPICFSFSANNFGDVKSKLLM